VECVARVIRSGMALSRAVSQRLATSLVNAVSTRGSSASWAGPLGQTEPRRGVRPARPAATAGRGPPTRTGIHGGEQDEGGRSGNDQRVHAYRLRWIRATRRAADGRCPHGAHRGCAGIA
jgi:hypothetical protein